MNKFKFYFTVIMASVLIFSCSKDDNNSTIEPPRDYAKQYTTEKTDIDTYIDTHYIFAVDNDFNISFGSILKTGKIKTSSSSDIITGVNTNFTAELLVGDELFMINGITKIGTILEISSSTTIKLTSNALSTNEEIAFSVKKETIRNQTTYPLLSKVVELNSVKYTLYYLVLRGGIGQSPCNTDGVLTAYRGDYLSSDATSKAVSAIKFEEVKFPETYFSLFTTAVIPLRGWSEILPQFKTGGTPTINPNGTVTYKDFGAGVMFLPSGFGYYNLGSGGIPAYAPLVFSFKLYAIQRLDSDGDGVLNFQEDLNGDGYMYDYRNTVNYPTPPTTNPDDTDGDKIPDFRDVDDDGDNYTTRVEITKPAGTNSGLSLYFPFDPIVDNPLTTIDETETKGIPEYSAIGSPDYTTPTRKRIHLDKDHHTEKP